MVQRGVTILREMLGEYFVVGDGEGSTVYYLQPYRPFAAYPAGCGAIDAYYFVSNFVYHRTRGVIAELAAAGVPAELARHTRYKEQLANVGIAGSALSTLCWTERYGTRFVVGALRVRERLPETPRTPARGCLQCGKCAAACPAGAITPEGFLRERCLRQKMEEAGFSDEDSRLIGTRLLGCGVCQEVCPLNAGVQALPLPDRVRELTDLEKLYRRLRGGDLAPLSAAVGSNYARRRRLMSLTVNAMGNTGDRRYLSMVREADCGEEHRARAIAKLEEGS